MTQPTDDSPTEPAAPPREVPDFSYARTQSPTQPVSGWAPAPEQRQPTSPSAAGWGGAPGPAAEPGQEWWRRTWVRAAGLAFAAFTVGGLIGSSSTGDLEARLAATEARAGQAEVRLGAATRAMDAAIAEKDQAVVAADRAKILAEVAVDDERKAVQAEKERFAEASDKQRAALEARAAAVSGLEAAAKASEFDGDGTYLIGVDVQPGTYRAADTGTCYWARLRNTDGGVGSIIANSIGDGAQVVTIRASDEAFETARCGTWKKVR